MPEKVSVNTVQTHKKAEEVGAPSGRVDADSRKVSAELGKFATKAARFVSTTALNCLEVGNIDS